jgi:hypothetical protein
MDKLDDDISDTWQLAVNNYQLMKNDEGNSEAKLLIAKC